jgi:hypothetical protein
MPPFGRGKLVGVKMRSHEAGPRMKNADPLWTLVVDNDPGSLVALYTNRREVSMHCQVICQYVDRIQVLVPTV